MAAIRLLAAPVDTPPTSEVNAEYSNRLALATRSSPSDTAYPADDYIWSASANSDGSFTFDATPQNSKNTGTSALWDGSVFSPASSSDWYTRNAAFQYGLHASMPTPSSGQFVSVYV